ncbi:MAG: hypothetical protein K8T90_09295 [Planctomycetes bacterium]|nr:hypothetical protein [Planctomycetota bacterium]
MTLIRTLLFAVAAIAALGLAPHGAAADGLPLTDHLAQVHAAANTAAAQLLAGNRAAAVGTMQLGSDGAEALDPTEILDPATRKRFQKQVTTLRKKFRDGLSKLNDAAVPALTAQRAIGSAADASLDADRILQRTDGGVLLEELGAKSAGFHDAAKSVLFRIQLAKTCPDEPVIRVVDESGGAVATTFEEVRRDASGGRVIRVTMGAAGGAGRVEVTSCGVTRRWLLFNYGPKGGYPTAPKPEASRFNGTWTGTFTGTASEKGGTRQVFGPVEFTVTNGQIRISEPGDGVGSISGTGRSRFSGGSGGIASATYRFQGLFVQFVVGGMSASGNWTATYRGGSARGRWSASRAGM